MMKVRYRLVVFDWEGTLGDTIGQVLNALSNESKQLHFGEFDEQLARKSVVFGLAKTIKKNFSHLTTAQQEQLLYAVQHSMATDTKEEYLMPGVRQTLQQLQQAGIDMAIATNKGKSSLQRALQATGLTDFFVTTRTAGEAPEKPCPQMLEEIMDVCGVTAQQTLMVGDSITDIEMARQIGVDAVGVDFYHQQEKNLRLAGAFDVFHNYQQLIQYIERSNLSGV